MASRRFALPVTVGLPNRPALQAAALALLLLACGSGAERHRGALDTAARFDHPGGWKDAGSCVDICGVTPGSPVERPPAVTCFDPADPVCGAKTGEGDYDYLLLSQHWLPTVCAGLEAGYDTTVTHRGAARCRPGTPARLAVHGLWPNYTGGFPQCCGEALPLDPAHFRSWPEALRRGLAADWFDPTTATLEAAVCELLNHEWQKHGTCFAPATGEGARGYFSTGLELASRLAEATAAVERWAGARRLRREFERLYPAAPAVLCDARLSERLLEIHTCWTRDLEPRDCPPPAAFGPLVPCGEEILLPRAG